MYINSVEHLKTCLRRNGYEIMYQDKQCADVRPYLIAWHRKSDTMVYIDLRVWESPPQYRPQRWYKNWIHRRKVKWEFSEWLRVNKWRGKHRFDVIEVFPPCGCVGRPCIDHITDVKM